MMSIWRRLFGRNSAREPPAPATPTPSAFARLADRESRAAIEGLAAAGSREELVSVADGTTVDWDWRFAALIQVHDAAHIATTHPDSFIGNRAIVLIEEPRGVLKSLDTSTSRGSSAMSLATTPPRVLSSR